MINLLIPIEFLTTKRFHNIIKNHGYIVFIPNGRIKFESGLGKKSSSPAFGSIVLRMGREKDFRYKRVIQHIMI